MNRQHSFVVRHEPSNPNVNNPNLAMFNKPKYTQTTMIHTNHLFPVGAGGGADPQGCCRDCGINIQVISHCHPRLDLRLALDDAKVPNYPSDMKYTHWVMRSAHSFPIPQPENGTAPALGLKNAMTGNECCEICGKTWRDLGACITKQAASAIDKYINE